MFKFYMIVDDSFCRLNEQMIVNDSFFGPQFCQKRAQTEMASGNMTKIAFKISRNILVAHSPHLLVGWASSTRNFVTQISNATSTRAMFVYNYAISWTDFVNYDQLSWTDDRKNDS